MIKERLLSVLSPKVRNQVESYVDAAHVITTMKDPRVLASLGPSGVRGLLLQRGKQGVLTTTRASYDASFDWDYSNNGATSAEMHELYVRAKQGQWDGDSLAWHTSVDPESPEVPVLPASFIAPERLVALGIHLSKSDERKVLHSLAAWMLSQFLHGEQGALFAAAQVTSSIPVFNGKLYGSTQVMDEGRHVEVFHRYLTEKMGKLYQVNDNLFTIIDALMADSRWDMKFLGMQIMVEGLALGAFGTLYKETREPLLRQLLKQVILDEARHVHYGVIALRDHIARDLTPRERAEREAWAFEVAVLMKNRFLAFEVYEEHFIGRMSRKDWVEFVSESPGMRSFRSTMFERLMPNLRTIGLLSNAILPHYEKAGLLTYASGKSACELTGHEMVSEIESAA
jgi:hypothetical protein